MPSLSDVSPVSVSFGIRPLREPFFGSLGLVLVDEATFPAFDGAIPRQQAEAIWRWAMRLPSAGPIDDGDSDAALPELVAAMRAELALAARDAEVERRLAIRVGDAESRRRLPHVITALDMQERLVEAEELGRALNAAVDDGAVAELLSRLPLRDPIEAALLFQVVVAQVEQPQRLVLAASKRVGSAMDTALIRAGYGPMIGAILAHARNQIAAFAPRGAFMDMDLTCRALERFHRLMRSVATYIDLGRLSGWTLAVTQLTSLASERLEPALRQVLPDVSQALWPPRDGGARFEASRLLAALNGIYLLVALRDSRDSLALNALIDEVWARVQQMLDVYIPRNLELVRAEPGNDAVRERLDAALTMSTLIFGTGYADAIRRAMSAS